MQGRYYEPRQQDMTNPIIRDGEVQDKGGDGYLDELFKYENRNHHGDERVAYRNELSMFNTLLMILRRFKPV